MEAPRLFNKGRRTALAAARGRALPRPGLVAGNLAFFSSLDQHTFALRTTDGKVVWQIGIGKYAPGILTEHPFSLNGILVAFRGT